MKMLINNSILNKFKDTISEEEYQKGWDKIQDYQSQADLISKYKETEFQSEFLSKIFGDILGYIPRSKSIKEANLIVEKKIEDGQKFIDGAIIGKDGRSRIVIELKSIIDTSAADLIKDKSAKSAKKSGLHGLAPIKQASIYLFSEPIANLAIVSNFDTVLVFDKKEKFRQEFSLFNMDYETFKEFYLILHANSYWSGLTIMMIKQSGEQEKDIDDEFYVKVKTLHNILVNNMKDETANDLFNKFLALAILEDSGVLPTNLINSIHSMKDDFTHTHNHWGLWSEFFKSMKSHKPGRELMGIDPSVSKMEVWQDISYLGRTKLQKSVLDLVVEISKYDLFSVSLQKLFYNIAIHIDSPYAEVLVDNPYEFYSELLKKNDRYGCDQASSFITLKTHDDTQPLITLFNQISNSKVIADMEGVAFSIAPNLDVDGCWTLKDLSDLDDEETVDLIKKRAMSIELYENELEPNYSFVLINLTFFGFGSQAADEIPLQISYGNDTFELDRTSIKNRIVLLSTEDQNWLDENINNSKIIGDFVEVVDEENADLRLNVGLRTLAKFDEDLKKWDNDWDDIIATENFLYLKVKNSDVEYILNSNEFQRVMNLVDWNETSFTELPVFEKLSSSEWLETAREYSELLETIRVYESSEIRLGREGKELELLKVQDKLEKLYEKQSEYEL